MRNHHNPWFEMTPTERSRIQFKLDMAKERYVDALLVELGLAPPPPEETDIVWMHIPYNDEHARLWRATVAAMVQRPTPIFETSLARLPCRKWPGLCVLDDGHRVGGTGPHRMLPSWCRTKDGAIITELD